ncbi:TetR/AcrR family transcriptional regulator [Curvivirga sp.]|uniref:TetR/AcrR family transcriptional regulator n=1 Tax=Curvivirga sp. TaxID=2856848 RepID=UPI003B5902A5
MAVAEEKKLPNSRVMAREARRQELIDATIDSIAKRGFSATTLTTVTKGAGVSHGVVNFHFKSKEALYDATLEYLTREHYEYWFKALEKAGDDPVMQLASMLEADFSPKTVSHKKLAVYFAFWGQAMYRPSYLDIHSGYDEERSEQIERIAKELIMDANYDLDPEVTARRLVTMIDGLWLHMLLYPKAVKRQQARYDCFLFLSELFPKHFDKPVLSD